MKKILILTSMLFLLLSTTTFAASKKDNDIVLKNKLFEITLPKNFKGIFMSEIKKDRIYIYDKQSKKSGFGGFAFGITAYKNPSQYASSGKKLGELVNKKNIYDIVITYPTEVQYDYRKGNNPNKSYKSLYGYGENVLISSGKKSTYYKNRGTKGNDLYNEVINKHIKAITEKWDSTRLEKENMSYMYNVIAKNVDTSKVLNSIGYKYYDLNGDGIEELLIGEIAQDKWKGVIYDVYTMVNRKPAHVISGGTRNRFYVCDDLFLCNEYSSGANESGIRVYNLVENSIELVPQVAFKYDGYKNEKNPYFITYGNSIENDDDWENVDMQTYEQRFSIFEKYQRFDYTPLSKFK